MDIPLLDGCDAQSGNQPASNVERRTSNASRSGIVYLLALLVVLVVSGVAMAMGQGAGQHLRMQQQAIAAAQCEAAALGVLQAVCNDLDASRTANLLPQLMTVKAEGEAVGDCTVVLVGRDPAGAKALFALIPEAARINLNVLATRTQPGAVLAASLAKGLGMLPGMDPTITAAIIDWCDSDDIPEANGGAERSDGTYTGAAVPYAPRNGEIQGLEELRLVRGVTDALFFGEDRNSNGMLDQGEDADADGRLTLGLRDACTLVSREPSSSSPNGVINPRTGVVSQGNLKTFFVPHVGQQRAARLASQVRDGMQVTSRLDLLAQIGDLTDDEAEVLWNAIEGPEGRVGLVDAWSCNIAVLEALVGTQVAQAIIAARPATTPTSPLWLVTALKSQGALHLGTLFTIGSYQFRADLLAVRNDGAGWVRMEAVIDASVDPTRILSLRSTATLGWPFPWATPEMLRRSQPADTAAFLATGQP